MPHPLIKQKIIARLINGEPGRKSSHTAERHIQTVPELSHPRRGQRSSDSEREIQTRTMPGWRRGRPPNGPPVACHRCHRGPAAAAPTSPQQTNRGNLTDTSEKSRLPQPPQRLRLHSPHHRCHRSLDANTTNFHRSRLMMPSSKDEALKGEYNTKASSSSDQTRSRVSPRAAAIRAEGVRQQNGDASKKVSDGHGRRHRESRP